MTNLFTAILMQAKAEKKAVASINILNYNTAKAVIEAAERANRNVILQPSTGTVRRYGVEPMFRMLDGLRKDAKVKVAIHLDHCTDAELAKACVNAGWDAVMMDFSALPMEENIQKTREMVEYAHARNVAVEGEVGVISGVEDDISHDEARPATFEDTMDFIAKTGVDAIAPSIGTAHGVYKGVPVLNYELVERLGRESTPIVVHGGTGLSVEAFHKLAQLGAAKINISTALKNVYLEETRKLLADPKINPIKLDEGVERAAGALMERHMRVFAGETLELS
ncbi:MAG: class II fructose-bisphosphate aldolase [Christensenellales bacterium]|jgi:ketose-bisphosphate aldolase